MEHWLEALKNILNGTALVTVIGTVAGWLPPLAALFAIIWYCVLLYDRFIGKNRLGGEDGSS